VFSILRTPFCFKIIHVKISISFHTTYHSRFNVWFWVSKRTEVSVFALVWRLFSTKFGFIFLYMVKPFNSVVSLIALIRA
jgi:hypothetical protein